MTSIHGKSFFTRQPQSFSKKQIITSNNKKIIWTPTKSALLASGMLTALGGIYWAYHRNPTQLKTSPFGMIAGAITAAVVIGSGIFMCSQKNTSTNILPPKKNESLLPRFFELFNSRDQNNEISIETAKELRNLFSFVKNEEEKCSMWNYIVVYLSTSNVSAKNTNQAFDILFCDLFEFLENQLNNKAPLENAVSLLGNFFNGLIKYSPLTALNLAIHYLKIKNDDKDPVTLKILSKIINTCSKHSDYKIPFIIDCLNKTEELDENTKGLLQNKIINLLQKLHSDELSDVLKGCKENKQLATKILETLYEPDACADLLKSLYDSDKSNLNQPSNPILIESEKEVTQSESSSESDEVMQPIESNKISEEKYIINNMIVSLLRAEKLDKTERILILDKILDVVKQDNDQLTLDFLKECIDINWVRDQLIDKLFDSNTGECILNESVNDQFVKFLKENHIDLHDDFISRNQKKIQQTTESDNNNSQKNGRCILQ